MEELIQSIVEKAIEAIPAQTLPNPDEVSYYVLERERRIHLGVDGGRSVRAV